MKKLGILTFHRAYNFGAVLQTYALETAINDILSDTEVCVIDYRNSRIENAFHAKSIKSKLMNAIKFLFYHGYYVECEKKAKLFDAFVKEHISLSSKCESIEDVKDSYDIIVAGSDQVWNLDMTHGDVTYFLPYDSGAKKLSYAASFGKTLFSDSQKNLMRDLLQEFETVLVRENAGLDIAKDFGVLADKVVDPTLLLNKEQWSLLCKPCKVNKPFILVYIVAEETYSISLAKKIAKEMSWDVLYVDPPRYKYDGIIRLKEAGPSEFLWLIMNAELVITTSYHGTILSMNLNTPFLYELSHVEGNTNSRLEDVVESYSLHKFTVINDDISNYTSLHYDWKSINNQIDHNRKKSIEKLISSII